MTNEIVKTSSWWEETIDTPAAEIIEENIYVDAKFIKNKELVRIDMNLIQFPIFSKNTKRKANQIVKYYFNRNKNTYIIVTPQAGDYIPGEMEEKVFIALMQIMKEKGMTRKIIISSIDLKEKLKLSTGRYNDLISKSLSRLSSTNYIFNNTLYSSEYNGIIGEKIETSIFNIRTITLDKKENLKYRESFSDKRIKTIYEIEFSEHFYKNIIQKGYMVYNGNTLLEIESSIARTVYMLIEKLRFDKLYLKIDTIFLIKRIPLKYDERNLTQTIRSLEKSFQELVNKKLIHNFNIIKESTWAKSEVEIYFDENANEIKQGRFYSDKNDFRKILSELTVSETEHDIVQEIKPIDTIKITLKTINEILELMPSKAKELKTLPKAIKESIEKYGYEKVKAVAIYMKKQKVDKVRSYFIKALENNWVEDEEIIVPKINKVLVEDIKTEITTKSSQYDENLYIEFEKLEINIQNGIETYAYRDYIEKCGMETKIQQLAFMGSRKKYICEYLEKYPEILGGSKEKKVTEEKEIYLTNIDKIKVIIGKNIKMASMLNKYSNEDEERILRSVLNELMQLITRDLLTNEKLDEVLKKYTGF